MHGGSSRAMPMRCTVHPTSSLVELTKLSDWRISSRLTDHRRPLIGRHNIEEHRAFDLASQREPRSQSWGSFAPTATSIVSRLAPRIVSRTDNRTRKSWSRGSERTRHLPAHRDHRIQRKCWIYAAWWKQSKSVLTWRWHSSCF